MKSLVSCFTASLLLFASGCSTNAPGAGTPLKGLSKEDPVYGYVSAAREDLSRGKVEIITNVMRLASEESKVFWPIYHDYEEELFELGDKRLELIRQFAVAQRLNQLDDRKASALADGYFQFEAARLELVKKYHTKIAREISPLHAAQFVQIEHRMGTVIDLLIASDLPLMHVASSTSK